MNFLIYAVKNYTIYEKFSENKKYNKEILLHKTDYLEKTQIITLINHVKGHINKYFSNL